MKQKKTTNLFEDIVVSEKVSSNKKVNPNSAISKEFLEYYAKRYELLFGVPTKINWGKDLKLVNSLLKTYNDVSIFGCTNKLEFLQKVCEKYFVSRDKLALQNCWNIGIFYYNFSKIVLLLKHGEASSIEPIIEGFTLAYLNDTGVKYTGIFTEHDEEVFMQLYIFLKPLWVKEFTLPRFSEIYFLVLFDHMRKKEYNLNFFISKYAIDFFTKWLETEGKEILMFYPRDVSDIDKERLIEEQNKMLIEEREIFYNGISK